MTEALKTIEEELSVALLAGEDYDAEKFTKLTDREHVRLRYGMYIGDSSVQGLHHLVYELVNNSIDNDFVKDKLTGGSGGDWHLNYLLRPINGLIPESEKKRPESRKGRAGPPPRSGHAKKSPATMSKRASKNLTTSRVTSRFTKA